VVRHYLNRTDEATHNDEWSYISEIGSKLEFKDVMDVPQRYITFGRKQRRKVKPSKTQLETTKEGIRWALDAAGNTGQYIRYVNMTIDKHQTQVDKIKNLQDKFDKEVALLDSHKIEKINSKKLPHVEKDVHTVKDYLNQLLLEKRITHSNLKNLRDDLHTMATELKLHEKQIEQVRENLVAKIINSKEKDNPINIAEAISIIREELTSIGQKYDVSKLSSALDFIISSDSK
jgi:hypothetical protein